MRMPLPDHVARNCLQLRSIECRGFQREGGLWDIEGHLVDTRTYPYASEERGLRDPGFPVHDMWVRLTVNDAFTVVAVATSMDAAPRAACPDIEPAYQGLVGLTIGKGWNQAVRALLGGERGCTHLVELLGPVASTTVQTIAGYRAAQQAAAGAAPAPQIVACHALARSRGGQHGR